MANSIVEVSVADLNHIKMALENAEIEFTELEQEKEWFVADSLDLIASSLQIVNSLLGLEEPEEEFEDGLD